MEYLDFIIRIESRRGEFFVVGIESPAGEGSSELRLPFAPADVGALLGGVGHAVRGTREIIIRAEQGAAHHHPPTLGDMLFQALFSGPCRDLFNTSLGHIQGREIGLRIKLHIDPNDPDLAGLASLPWELMYRAETRDFLSLSRGTPLVRYLDVQRPFALLPFSPPLRILVAVSSPAGAPPLDLAHERKAIETTWGKRADVAVDFLDRVTSRQLTDRLAARHYHVLHFMGHGDFDPDRGTGVLLLEDDAGQPSPIDGATLGMLLRDVASMRLVFLNACNTARVGSGPGLDPFAGVASALVMAGVPAVVAMQFPISDNAAIEFASTFYPRLVEGFPVDAAVAEARKAIRMADRKSWEWATPVLFMRSKDGALFETAAAAGGEEAEGGNTAGGTGARQHALAARVQAMQALNATFAPERYTMLALIIVSALVFLVAAWSLVPSGSAHSAPQAGIIPVTGASGSAVLFLVSRLLKINERTVAMVREMSAS
ncbi:MAG: CHAT domain-containing protein [Gemmatimonadota bacterium]